MCVCCFLLFIFFIFYRTKVSLLIFLIVILLPNAHMFAFAFVCIFVCSFDHIRFALFLFPSHFHTISLFCSVAVQNERRRQSFSFNRANTCNSIWEAFKKPKLCGRSRICAFLEQIHAHTFSLCLSFTLSTYIRCLALLVNVDACILLRTISIWTESVCIV